MIDVYLDLDKERTFGTKERQKDRNKREYSNGTPKDGPTSLEWDQKVMTKSYGDRLVCGIESGLMTTFQATFQASFQAILFSFGFGELFIMADRYLVCKYVIRIFQLRRNFS